MQRLVDKSATVGFVDNADLNNKVAKLATKAQLKAKQDEIVKLQSFNSSYFRCKSHFADDDTQKCFSRFISILFQHGNPKDCLMKALGLLLHLIIVLFLH